MENKDQLATLKTKTISFLKRVSALGIIIFVATFLQLHWSMGHLSESMSSACLECWFVEDVMYLSLITALFLGILFTVLPSQMNRIFIMTVQFLLLISIWFFWDYSIFVERESSWSTYLFNEEIHYVIYYSALPISTLSLAALLFINHQLFIKKYGEQR
ncbi:hypothetical protein OMO38_14155 [Chryseobacterium sp. 09-1422]|uniref:Disulfide bond formation protein B n=1 Tax=Chryseobacterium kimseyorum TaxID=2984028 RepID=A0ABT3I0R5_9FLAO|nr:hypothetical protein [Chryseobacterium kimseyorum]MCW3169665.1 hypothetical protein [Chryseobacterium kimseyorum]